MVYLHLVVVTPYIDPRALELTHNLRAVESGKTVTDAIQGTAGFILGWPFFTQGMDLRRMFVTIIDLS